MRSAEQKMLNAVQRPEAYREVVLGSAGARIVLSVWAGTTGMPVVLFLPGTMTHPLFYEEFLDALNRAGLTVAGLHGQGHGKSPRVHRPLTFASLVENARDAAGMRDGSITCPVTVIAGRGDPLFPLAYIREVYDRIVAPCKDLLVLDSDVHLLFNEDLATVLPPLLERLQAVAARRLRAPS